MLLLWLFSVAAIFAPPQATIAEHPVYLSVTEIHYKPEKQSIEIAIKVFSDDFSEALSRLHKRDIEIGTDREPSDATKLIRDYIGAHFSIRADDKILTCNYIGREVERIDFFAMWIYFEVRGVSSINKLYVENSILFDYFSTQNNIITLRDGERVRRASLLKNNGSTSFEF
jgi:hypothetical protein